MLLVVAGWPLYLAIKEAAKTFMIGYRIRKVIGWENNIGQVGFREVYGGQEDEE